MSLFRFSRSRALGRSLAIAAIALFTLPLQPQMPAEAQVAGIAAVVNDSVITIADVNARVSMVLASSNIPNTPDIREKLVPQVVRQLINEALELQEAKKLDITASKEEIDGAIKQLEKQNNMPPGGLDKFLALHGIPRSSLISQIRAEYVWGRLVRARYGASMVIGDNDVADAKRQILAQQNQAQNRVAEIFLPVDSPSQDEMIHDAGMRLAAEIKQGARFPDVARQFSQSPSAAVGGDLGWVAPGMLAPDIQKVIDQMEPGTLAGPVRLTGGYYILLLIDRRAAGGAVTSLNLTQVVLPVPDNADIATANAAAARLKQATANARSCDDMNAIGKQLSPQTSGPLGTVAENDLPPDLRPLLMNAKVAVPLQPTRVHGGIGVFMVCGRSGGVNAISNDQVSQALQRQRFENIAQRYLSDLRRVAYIDQRV